MSKKVYRVYAHYHASKLLGEYVAKTREEAENMSEKDDDSVSLCHHCAREINVGNPYEYGTEYVRKTTEEEENCGEYLGGGEYKALDNTEETIIIEQPD